MYIKYINICIYKKLSWNTSKMHLKMKTELSYRNSVPRHKAAH